MSKLSGRIIDLLMLNGMSQRDLARAIGTTEVTMSRYVRGERVPKGHVIVKMAEALKCSADYLLGMTDENISYGCEYCDADRKDWKYDTLPVNMGDFGDWQLCFSVSNSRKLMEIDFEEEHCDPLISTHLKINYCPYCGRKLGKKVDNYLGLGVTE